MKKTITLCAIALGLGMVGCERGYEAEPIEPESEGVDLDQQGYHEGSDALEGRGKPDQAATGAGIGADDRGMDQGFHEGQGFQQGQGLQHDQGYYEGSPQGDDLDDEGAIRQPGSMDEQQMREQQMREQQMPGMNEDDIDTVDPMDDESLRRPGTGSTGTGTTGSSGSGTTGSTGSTGTGTTGGM